MAELGLADLDQQYSKCLINYKGRIVYVGGFDGALNIHYTDISTGKRHEEKVDVKALKPILNRLGFVNHNGHALYLRRVPVRRYQVGISTNNSNVLFIEHFRYHKTISRALDQVRRLTVKSIVDMFNNSYPPLKNAIDIAVASEGACAFDKQFAVDCHRNIYYRNRRVGTIPPRCTTLKRIEFNKGFEFLETVLEPSYEKTVRTFETA